MLCANVVLDRPADSLMQMLGNKIYEACRADQLKIAGFPLFGPAISAIKDARPADDSRQYAVCVRKHDRLVVLQSLAEKWMSTDFKDQTSAELESHNARFNKDGEFWHQDEQRPANSPGFENISPIVFLNGLCY